VLNLEVFSNKLFFYIIEINNAENYDRIGKSVLELSPKEKIVVIDILKSENQ